MRQTLRNADKRVKTHHSKKRSTRRSTSIAHAGLGGLSALLLIGVGAALVQENRDMARNAAIRATYTPAVSAAEKTQVLRFVAVGDSVTEANSPSFVEGRVGDGSWVTYAESNEARFAGGWADGGVQTSTMVDNFKPVEGSDVLVMLAGTNDSSNGTPFADTAANLVRLAEIAGTDRVIVSSIPPQNEDPERATSFNTKLETFTKERGWEWVDAAAGLREGDIYEDGLTNDGTHPTKEGARIIGQAIGKAITADASME